MIGCVGLIALLLPGIIAGLLLQSWLWGTSITVALLAIVGIVFYIRSKHRITPQTWAAQLEKHLLGTEGPYDWQHATSKTFADKKLDTLRVRIASEYKALDTPEKKEAFQRIIDSLQRGEIP